jgi:predicted PurR-regulated permease PerM
MVLLRFKDYGKLLFFIVFIAFLWASYKIISPFLPYILGSIILAIAVYPLYNKINQKLKKKNLSALLIILFLILILIIPILFFANTLLHEAITLHNSIGTLDLHTPSEKLKEVTGLNIEFDRYIEEIIQDFSGIFIQSGSKIISFLATGFIYLFTTFFLLFFLLRDGKKLANEIKKAIPLSMYLKNRLYRGINKIISGLFLGFLVMGVLEFVASFIGFSLFGIPNPLLWSFLIAVFTLIPILGPAAVWIPATIYLLAIGNVQNAIFLVIYFSLILSFYMESILRPQLIGKTAQMNPVVALLGILGGIKLFGIVGIIIGPLILSLFVLVYRLYREENDNAES